MVLKVTDIKDKMLAEWTGSMGPGGPEHPERNWVEGAGDWCLQQRYCIPMRSGQLPAKKRVGTYDELEDSYTRHGHPQP